MTGLRAILGLPQGQAMDLAGAYNHLSNNMDARAADIMRVAERVSGTARVVGLTGRSVGAPLSFLSAVDTAEDKVAIIAQLFGQEYADDLAKLVSEQAVSLLSSGHTDPWSAP